MISEKQKQRVQSQLRALTDLPVRAGDIFYCHLFKLVPEAQSLFGNDLTSQSEKLMDMVGLIAHYLDNEEALRAEIDELGRRHVGYGVQPAQLNHAKTALLRSLSVSLSEWTSEDEDAWDALLTMLVDQMVQGMSDREEDAARRFPA